MSWYANTDSETLKHPKPRPLNVNCENAHSYDYESRQNESKYMGATRQFIAHLGS